jgi:hypothetical protein
MSGGHFDYKQEGIREIAEEIAQIVKDNDDNSKRLGYGFSPAVVEKLKLAAQAAYIAEAMIQRVDWLICGDDGEESFLHRWDEELAKINALRIPDVRQDPVHKRGGEWYFYDETWAFEYGPFNTEAAARKIMSIHAEKNLGIKGASHANKEAG